VHDKGQHGIVPSRACEPLHMLNLQLLFASAQTRQQLGVPDMCCHMPPQTCCRCPLGCNSDPAKCINISNKSGSWHCLQKRMGAEAA